ncbi:MAG: HAMP domain-containing sensor histidine kinase, partial [Spirochaetales bacterium]|nr:HAMP domain-containing sensor histidine kinase [Spirochaetales bacterium]
GEMGLNIAHEIKNPLTAVKGFSQLMHRRNVDRSKMNEYLALMDDELNRIDKLLNDLLINGGRSRLKLESVDFYNILREFVVIYTNIYPDINFKMETYISASAIVKVDKNKIAQLLDNLVKNSVESIHEKTPLHGKNIEFNLLINSDEIILKIKDNGKGIPPENVNRIMTPFFTTKAEGNGLGMNLCLGIVEKHNGNIRVFSKPEEFTEVVIKFKRELLEKLYDAQNIDS